MTETASEPAEHRLRVWVGESLGGEVVDIERQERWRPCWFIEAEMPDGTERSFYVRGSRTGNLDPQFEMEYELFRALEAEGIPVPAIHGLCLDPVGIVMDKAKGRADLSTAESDAERAAVLNEYIEVLARIHAIDPKKFDGISLPRPDAGGNVGLAQFENYVESYKKAKRRAEPVLEFLIGWVRRNAPKHRRDLSLVLCDPAQFMFENSKLTAVLDLEMAFIGDPLHDLAALQLRDTSEPLGKLAPAIRHYEEVTGSQVDEAVFDYYAIAWSVVTPVSMTDAVTKGLPTGNVLQYLEWWVTFCRVPLELIASTIGIALDKPTPLVSEPDIYAPLQHSLIGAIEAIPVEGGFAQYELASTAKLAGYLERVAEFGPAIRRKDTADIEALLDRQFASWQEADTALETFVQEAGPEHDERLIRMLHARSQRQAQLIAPFLSRSSVGMTLKTYSELMAD